MKTLLHLNLYVWSFSWAFGVTLVACSGQGAGNSPLKFDKGPEKCIEGEGVREVLAPCGCGFDCASGICSSEAGTGDPGGSCVVLSCQTDEDCGDHHLCSRLNDEISACYERCETNEDCSRLTHSCSSLGICINMCQDNSECSDARVCDPYRGRCVESTELSTGGAGTWAPCVQHEECRSEFCAHGRCVSNCSVTRQGCSQGEVCVDLFESDLGWCFAPCDDNTDCPEPETKCMVPFGLPNTEKVCVPTDLDPDPDTCLRPPDPSGCPAISDYGAIEIYGNPVASSSGGTADDPTVIYVVAMLTPCMLPDILEVFLIRRGGVFGGPITTGTYQIEAQPDLNVDNCAICVLLKPDRDWNADPPISFYEGNYFATRGTVTITSVSPRVTGTITDVTFERVEIDPASEHSTPHPDGCLSHLGSLSFDALLRRFDGVQSTSMGGAATPF